MSNDGILIFGIFFATFGWAYTARRSRILSRKQHTINVIIQANFNQEYIDARSKVASMIRSGICEPSVLDGTNEELLACLRRVLNHSEFVAAGVRNGDLDEMLLKDSERALYVQLFSSCNEYIWGARDRRERQAIYEHLQWLYERWTETSPPLLRTAWEYVMAKPWYGRRRS